MAVFSKTGFGEVWHAIFPRWEDLTRSWFKKKIIKHFLPLGFLFTLIFALIWDVPGKEAGKWHMRDFKAVSTICVCLIFFISGITLSTKDIKEAFSAWPSFLYGLSSILAITPLFGFIAVHIPFSPNEFRRGLALFAAVPTTLTSGVTMVTQAGGNRAFALMMTVVTNLAGVGTVPLYLNAILSSSDVTLDVLDLFKRLVLTLLAPLLIGKMCLEFIPWVAGFTKRHKTFLSLTASTALIITVWITLCQSASALKSQSGKSIMIMIAAAVVLHVAYLVLNLAATKMLRTGKPEAKGVIIMCSQKTLPVALTILSNLSEAEIGSKGLVAIPCIVCHMSQLFIDSVLVSYWASQWEKEGSASSGAKSKVASTSEPPVEGQLPGGTGVKPEVGSLAPAGAASREDLPITVAAEPPGKSGTPLTPKGEPDGRDPGAGDTNPDQGKAELQMCPRHEPESASNECELARV